MFATAYVIREVKVKDAQMRAITYGILGSDNNLNRACGAPETENVG